jgi:hypothetical protein
VQLERHQLGVGLDATDEVRVGRSELGHELLERFDELGADRAERGVAPAAAAAPLALMVLALLE